MIFKIELLPARYGDCIWISYGSEDSIYRILIDGGTRGTSTSIIGKIAGLPATDRRFELVVVTHIDQDHLQGMQAFLEQDKLGVQIGDFWFNGYDHLPKSDVEGFGALQAEKMSKQILEHKLSWNGLTKGAAIALPDDEGLLVFSLPGGLKLTLLAPTLQALGDLRPVWERETKSAGLVPGFGTAEPPEIPDHLEAFGGLEPDVEALNREAFNEDHSEANASSIAFLAECDGKRALFLGDSLPSQICKSLRVMQPEGKIKVDVVKVSHHASLGNTSPELIELLECKRFAISTNGSIYGHPKPATVARLIKRAGPDIELLFNYRSKANGIWDSEALKAVYRYSTTYLNEGEEIVV